MQRTDHRLLQEAGREYVIRMDDAEAASGQLARHATDIGPALPGPHHARGEAGEEVSLLLVAVMPQVMLVAVMVAVVMTAAMPAARGRIARSRECGGERNHGNGGDEE